MELPVWKSIFRSETNPVKEIFHFLKTTALFQGLPNKHIREVARLVHRRNYQAEEIVFRQGQMGAGLFLIFKGKVEIQSTHEGVTLKLATLEPGSFFGELSLFSEEPRSATATCQEDSILLGFFQPELDSLIQTKPRTGNAILLAFSKVITKRLINTNQVLEIAYFKGKKKKVDK
ncbi:cyclic nucleotide-binding domain-containing protein [Leptospira sp. GIMC2001]|uniref:cyclic nucleotide-binding domain-containing protein n=1 Tax=Leptospira sp. GIMC2001 TaxID=1513297 RepID=UPI00234AB31C|nr:cyclic nucleotide-binding domain-containing protein [Leptospira sp. GIMC2001]WCL50371.1 cyclic nucleotide-binding domain-containing protein [Leptospira sp. GIMC2001]